MKTFSPAVPKSASFRYVVGLGLLSLAAVALISSALPESQPASANPISGITTVHAGTVHTCAVTNAGALKCWGNGWAGQIGDGFTEDRLVPTDVVGLGSGTAAVSAGAHTCALTTAGGAKCWGDNDHGQLGDGTTMQRHTPVDVVGLTSGVAAISVGDDITCALTTSGGAKYWGYNSFGKLGDGTTTERHTPVDVVGLTSGVAAISAGDHHTCALTTGGAVKCWGWNLYGGLGNGQSGGFDPNPNPVDVIGMGSGVDGLSTGRYYTCATGGGAAKCWGYNFNGQLGDGTTSHSSTPVDVVGLSSGVDTIVSGEGSHTCALMASGGVKCWGYNGDGRLGDGTENSSDTPIDVAGLSSGVAEVAVGNSHSCALSTGGGLQCWGDNLSGALGNGTTSDSFVPRGRRDLGRKRADADTDRNGHADSYTDTNADSPTPDVLPASRTLGTHYPTGH
jgi:alpha-tubulin suppressor-like RCC1 family protein